MEANQMTGQRAEIEWKIKALDQLLQPEDDAARHWENAVALAKSLNKGPESYYTLSLEFRGREIFYPSSSIQDGYRRRLQHNSLRRLIEKLEKAPDDTIALKIAKERRAMLKNQLANPGKDAIATGPLRLKIPEISLKEEPAMVILLNEAHQPVRALAIHTMTLQMLLVFCPTKENPIEYEGYKITSIFTSSMELMHERSRYLSTPEELNDFKLTF